MCFLKKIRQAIRNIIKNTLCRKCELAASYDLDMLKRNCPNKECRRMINGMIQKIHCEVALPLIKKGGKHASKRVEGSENRT